MPKAEAAFRTIGEAADRLDVPQHVLRFWEARFPQVAPRKSAGGRRYYRPGDLDLLAAIRKLLYVDGYTIKGVQRLIRSEGIDAVRARGREPDETRDAEVDASPPADRAQPTGTAEGAATDEGLGDRLDAIAAALEDCARILAAAREKARPGPS